MKNPVKYVFDLIFITRPVVLVPVWGFALFGYRLSSQTNTFFAMPSAFSLLWIFVFSLSVASVYVINQIADRKVDEKNGGFPLLIKSGISDNAAWTWAIILGAVSAFLPLAFGQKTVSLLAVVSLVLGALYCLKPFSFSGRPILDFLSNAAGYGFIAFAVGLILGAGGNLHVSAVANGNFLRTALPYFLMMAGGSISSTLPDYDGDKAEQKITTAVVFGKRAAHLLAFFFVLSAAALALYLQDFAAFWASCIASVFYLLYAIFFDSRKLMEACYKAGGAASMLVIGAFYPILIVAGGLVAASSLLYFRVFYKVSYPSLLPVEEK